jgi:chromate transport protein ChrA
VKGSLGALIANLAMIVPLVIGMVALLGLIYKLRHLADGFADSSKCCRLGEI